MNWEQCRNYGLVEIDNCETIRLYYDRFNYEYARLGTGSFRIIESAMWQGNNLMVNGITPGGERRTYMMTGFSSSRPIFN